MPEELTLLPCPACGGRAWVHYDPTTIRIYCPRCDILGPKKILSRRRVLHGTPCPERWNGRQSRRRCRGGTGIATSLAVQSP